MWLRNQNLIVIEVPHNFEVFSLDKVSATALTSPPNPPCLQNGQVVNKDPPIESVLVPAEFWFKYLEKNHFKLRKYWADAMYEIFRMVYPYCVLKFHYYRINHKIKIFTAKATCKHTS